MKATPILFFLALAAASATPPEIRGLQNHPEIAPELASRVLISELNCTACHASRTQPAGAPDLTQVAARALPGYLEAFIADPAATKPGTTMPHVLHTLPEDERKTAASAIADYLASLTDETVSPTRIDRAAADRGSETYLKVGCAACHAPEFPGLENKYTVTSLTAFLEDPLAARPGGRMPDSNLDHFEAVDIANYLLRDQKSKLIPARERTHPDIGRALFQKHGCAQCHTPEQAQPEFAGALSEVDLSKPCPTAHFNLSEKQRTQLATPNKPTSPAQRIELTLTRLNCIACHTRDGYGGVTPKRDPHFTTANLNLGEQARIPPTLTGVGAKLDPKWLRKVLLSGESARPYMHTRMPKFGQKNIEHLLPLFAEVDAVTPTDFKVVTDQKKAREAGHALAGTDNLSCVACHTWKGESATTLNGLELTTMAQRLQRDWFNSYLRNPQRYHPSTIMPNFWPGGEPVRPDVLGADTGMQIDAIWQYLARGPEARTPKGIKREPIHYGPGDDGRAVILRRQYRGIGKRGIGVGYPGGINIAFDATQLRLGSIWPGDFGEMSGVWRGQGSGNVNEGSRDVVRFPTGPGIATLPAPGSPWPGLPINEKPEGYQFKGYTLDKKGRPTFRYTIGEIEIEDHLINFERGILRTLVIDHPAPPDLYLLIAEAKHIDPLDGNKIYHLDRDLHIEVPSGTFLFESKEIRLPLEGRTNIQLYYLFRSKK